MKKPSTAAPERPRKKAKKRRPRGPSAATDRVVAHGRADAAKVLEHQRYLGLGATIAIVGLALVGTHASKAGALVVVVGLLVLMGSVHRFGRLGTERVARR